MKCNSEFEFKKQNYKNASVILKYTPSIGSVTDQCITANIQCIFCNFQ